MTAGRNRAVKYGLYAILLIICFVLQNLPGFLPPIFGARPQLLLAAALTIAILEPELPALFFGLGAGLLMDFSLGGSTGLSAIILTVLCCFFSVLMKKLHVTLGSALGMGGLFVFVAVILDWLFRYALAGYAASGMVLVDHYLPLFFYTLLTLPLLYLLQLGIYVGLQFFEPAN